MSTQTLPLDDKLYKYLLKVSLREHEVLKKCREKTASLPSARMQISPEQGQFMKWVLELLQAKNTLEIGVFTGYSTLCTALALPKDGKIIACDVSEKWTSIAKTFWKEAGVENKIDLILAPAEKTLEKLIQQKHTPFDFVFIDADKENYLLYYEKSLDLLRPGGVMMIDNTLWGGAVADEKYQDNSTIAIRQFNEFMHQDDRISLSLVPIGDGLTLARKK
jgi:predicted O-methyltransferase YrrM